MQPKATVELAEMPASARARAKLALSAEKAWGVGALLVQRRLGAPHGLSGPAQEPADTAPPLDRTAAASPKPHSCVNAKSPQPGLFGGAGAEPHVISPAEDAFAELPPDRTGRISLLKALDEQEVRGCTRCPLCEKRRQTVFGEGDADARLMFIGEGPGETEDATGRPFVGRAGALLDKMIAGMGLQREQVYIANVVKCRPPNNRVPTLQEVSTCTPYLHKQIEWIRPRVIVTLGLPATRHLLKTTASMGALRGRWNQWRGIRVMPTYHPAFLLRSYTDENRRIVWGDLQQVMTELGLSPRNARVGAS